VLLFFITLSLYGFVVVYQRSRKTFPIYAFFYLGMAGAFLSKGIIGVGIPVATVLVFLITLKDLKAIRKLFLNPGVLFFLLPVLLWGGSVWWFEGPGIIKEVIQQSLSRFFSPSADHTKPFYYYFIHGFTPLLPWAILPLFLLWYRWKPTLTREPLSHGSLLRFALVWFLTVFIGLSLASAKRAPLYLGPLYPSFALLAALGWDHIREKIPKVKRGEFYALIVMFFAITGTYLLFVTPTDRRESLRPVFQVISTQRTKGPVYLVNPYETIRGASFFYLGKRMPVLNVQDLLLGRFEDQPGTTLVMGSYCYDSQLLSHLLSRGYRPLMQKKFRKDEVICIYSNSS
jgi:4-amino-4-deoxy-L-arabinose transferase-like glycosyltransferase